MARNKLSSKPNGNKKRGANASSTSISNKRAAPSKSNAQGNKRKKFQANQNLDSGNDSDELGPSADFGNNDSISSDEIDPSSDSEFEKETEAEKRLRLAKEYVSKLEEDASIVQGFDAADIDRELISSRLQQDVEENAGRIYRRIADKFSYEIKDLEISELKSGHHLSVTSVAITPDGNTIFSGSKDGSIVKWDLKLKKKLITIKGQKKSSNNPALGHTDTVLSFAISTDGKYLASGSSDRFINIWNVETLEHITTFRQHKDAVTGLAFRKGHNQLYSCSLDRMVKLWNVDQRGYIETLFGHQDGINDICTIQREQAVTVGSRDKTARTWKIIDETQLLFRGGTQTIVAKVLNKSKTLQNAESETIRLPGDEESDSEQIKTSSETNQADNEEILSVKKANDAYIHDLIEARKKKLDFNEGSIDVISMIDEETFVTGGDSGAISLWSFSRKKPIFTYHLAHGIEIEGSTFTPRWITSLVCHPLSDVFISGSYDGFLRIWKLHENKSSGFSLINTIPMAGYINRIVLHEDIPKIRNNLLLSLNPLTVVVAVGQEHKMGRWNRIKSIKNSVKTFQIEPLK
ncbi:hypothetical protein BB561_000368 [Smittium simulii]|uniref:Ribosomal RNA-processing protein 9 n=1 Tax=Smittium simulii TaxID=133385 RepID=A0A2T9YZC3_9FUNG|nr:hypothetical protein BB561_000368 [Smittium simulii]